MNQALSFKLKAKTKKDTLKTKNTSEVAVTHDSEFSASDHEEGSARGQGKKQLVTSFSNVPEEFPSRHAKVMTEKKEVENKKDMTEIESGTPKPVSQIQRLLEKRKRMRGKDETENGDKELGEDELFKLDMQSRPEEVDSSIYTARPIDGFGLVMLQKMGMRPEDRVEGPPEPKIRGFRQGFGAKISKSQQNKVRYGAANSNHKRHDSFKTVEHREYKDNPGTQELKENSNKAPSSSDFSYEVNGEKKKRSHRNSNRRDDKNSRMSRYEDHEQRYGHSERRYEDSERRREHSERGHEHSDQQHEGSDRHHDKYREKKSSNRHSRTHGDDVKPIDEYSDRRYLKCENEHSGRHSRNESDRKYYEEKIKRKREDKRLNGSDAKGDDGDRSCESGRDHHRS